MPKIVTMKRRPYLLSKSQLAKLNTSMRGTLLENHLLAPHTAWRAGGTVKYFYQPADLEDLVTFLRQIPHDLPLTWLGAATNVLIRDGGVRGAVICVRSCLDELESMNSASLENAGNGAGGDSSPPSLLLLRAGAGVRCSRLVQYATRLGAQDAAFLAGIPGTVGGALAMNAGAYGGEMWQHVVKVTTIDRYGNLRERPRSDFQANYREVIGLQENEWNEWFVACELRFAKDVNNIAAARARIRELLLKRRASQPLNTFNCGSVFRNPVGDYAARLIETCDLKNMRLGGAVVSAKHANFIINDGTATATDIEVLIKYVVTAVKQRCGVELKPEVKILGDFP